VAQPQTAAHDCAPFSARGGPRNSAFGIRTQRHHRQLQSAARKCKRYPPGSTGSFPTSPGGDVQRVRQTYGIEGDYILSVGAIQPRKNLSRLVAAYSNLHWAKPEGKLPKLVLVGKCAWLYDETLRTIKELEVSNSVILTGYVPAADLPALYSGALCFVYPSYFEGFGLPPLEAMKCGAPVIVGNKTSLPEVVGDAGLLVDPFDVDDLAAQFKEY